MFKIIFALVMVSTVSAMSLIRSENPIEKENEEILIRSARYTTSAWKSRNSRKRDRRAMKNLLKKLDTRTKKPKFSGNFLHGFRLIWNMKTMKYLKGIYLNLSVQVHNSSVKNQAGRNPICGFLWKFHNSATHRRLIRRRFQ